MGSNFLETGEIGELIVSGPQISPLYVTRTEANATGKIPGNVLLNDGSQSQPAFWHRMGDVGYLDSQDRFWFCGRMAHRVVAAAKTFFSIPSEAIFLQSEQVNRAALVGITDTKASAPKTKLPVIIIEPKNPEICKNPAQVKDLLDQMRALAKTSPLTEDIHLFLVHPQFPVDIRHNAKIFREKLAIWAEANRDSAGCN